MSDHAFGIDTLIVPAALVPEGDQDAAQEAMTSVGPDAVRLPAVLVPPGGTPPGGEYVMIGVLVGGSSDSTADAQPDPTPEAGRTATPPPTLHTPGQARDPIAAGSAARRAMAPNSTGRTLAKPAKPG
jgi:hypothetical protein